MGMQRSGVGHGGVDLRAQGEDEVQYVLAVVAVPIAIMCAMLIMERLEHHVLGPPAQIDKVPPASTVERTIVVETPRAA